MLNFQVDGMSCDHCRRAVTAAFDRCRPQARVEVDLDSGQVTVGIQAPGRPSRRPSAAPGYEIK